MNHVLNLVIVANVVDMMMVYRRLMMLSLLMMLLMMAVMMVVVVLMRMHMVNQDMDEMRLNVKNYYVMVNVNSSIRLQLQLQMDMHQPMMRMSGSVVNQLHHHQCQNHHVFDDY